MTQCACGSYNVDVIHQSYEYVYKGYVQEVERAYSECEDCGMEFQTPSQINECYAGKVSAQIKIEKWIVENEGD